MNKAIEKRFVNGRLMAVQVHQWEDGQPLPERRRIQALRFPGGGWWHFPIPEGDIFSPNEGDVLVVRWVRADQAHYIKRGGQWWRFESRKAYREFMTEINESGNYRHGLGPRLVTRTYSLVDGLAVLDKVG